MIDPVKETSDIAEQIFGKDYRTQVTFQARIKLAKMNIAYLQRYGRLVKRGLTEMKDNLRWWQLYSYLRWRIDWFFYEKSLSLRIKELVVSWERVIKFPNNLVFEQAKKEHEEFCRAHRTSLAIMRNLPNQDMMEM